MLHGYRSSRGRVASHSVQPAGYGRHHEAGSGVIPGGQEWRGLRLAIAGALLVGRIDLTHETSFCSSSSVGVGARCACVRISSGNPRGAHGSAATRLVSTYSVEEQPCRRRLLYLRLRTSFSYRTYLSIYTRARLRLVRSDETSYRRGCLVMILCSTPVCPSFTYDCFFR